MIKRNIDNFYLKKHCTLLGVGPMSKNCVDSTIELANEYEIPIMLIASRRQIDSEDMGGGYVNNWSTEEFAKYVIENDKKGKIILARDHGGPWQNTVEIDKKFSLRQAMESAKASFETDIRSGFEMIHIDPSVDIYGKPSSDEILSRLFELYEFCYGIARKLNKEIIFEVGTEEQSGSAEMIEEFEKNLIIIQDYCKKNRLPQPSFIVAQTGTKVLETSNVGTFDSPIRISNELPAEIQVPKIIEICNKNNIYLKQHNTDYLTDEALKWHPKLGIHSANVAPEFGVAETCAFLNILKENQLFEIYEEFIDLAYSSGKWTKWMIPNSTSDKNKKAIIAGHYIFAKPHFIELKEKAQRILNSKNINIDEILKIEIKKSIMRYLKCFKVVG